MGILTDVFGGPEAGLLAPEDQSRAGKQALRDFGLSLIMSGAPPGGGKNAPPLLAAVAAGTQAGRQSYQNYFQRKRAAETAGDIEKILAGGLTPKALEDAIARATAGGDIDTARTLVPLLQSQISAQGGGEALKPIKDSDPITGETIFIDPVTLQEIGRINVSEDILPPGLQGQRDQVYSRFNGRASNLRDVANSYRRVLSATNTLLAQERESAAARARGQEYTRPTAAAMAAISSFARLLDPGSVVREGEFHIVSNQGSLVDRVRRWYDQIINGTIPEGLAQALQDEAYRQTTAQRNSYEELMQQAWNEGSTAGINKRFIPIDNPFQTALQAYRAGDIESFNYDAWDQDQEESAGRLKQGGTQPGVGSDFDERRRRLGITVPGPGDRRP